MWHFSWASAWKLIVCDVHNQCDNVATLNVEISFQQGRTDRIRKHNYLSTVLEDLLGGGGGGVAGRFCEFFYYNFVVEKGCFLQICF